ncbi:diguanylate cyclase [Shewanella acanthi]|uniref:diguanylate cyclase n=1 Tax=Shewanella acanthi TaxID=2864212 RepID=UPI001C65A5A3|nr:diguanylate cyclase [Shewanella acanthi]QYJ77949.1 diguanylate cyclase [Shewanella acanthi]
MKVNAIKNVGKARYSFSPKEAESSLAALDLAIENHRNWYIHLHEGLLCNQMFSDTVTDIAAHTKCKLGCWYYNVASETITSHPDFQELAKAHQSLHDQARKLVTEFKSVRVVDINEYRLLTEKQIEVMNLLVRMRDCIIDQQHCFDPLTGLLNRKSMGLLLDKNHTQFLSHSAPYVIAMLDIDFFKAVNDTYGHLGGDEVLKSVSNYLSSAIRDSDCICRYGGEEFQLLLPSTTLEVAERVLERLRQGIANVSVPFESKNIKVTISIGYALSKADIGIGALVKQADIALYQAKASGRNRVVQYDPDIEGK